MHTQIIVFWVVGQIQGIFRLQNCSTGSIVSFFELERKRMNTKKLIQAVNVLLEENGGRMNYTKLIKLLYIADKQSIKEIGAPITGDRYYSLPKGPILSKLLNLIKVNIPDDSENSVWKTFFSTEGYDLVKNEKNHPGYGKLSRREMRILKELSISFKDKSYSDMIEYVHQENKFPEVRWREAGIQKRIPISLKDLYKSLGLGMESLKEYNKEIKLLEHENRILSKCC